MDVGVFPVLTDWLMYTLEALAELFDYNRVIEAVQIALPYLAWAGVGASMLLVSNAAGRIAIRAGELVLVALLYLLGLPIILVRSLFAFSARLHPATNPFDEEPSVPATDAAPGPPLFSHAPSPPDLLDRALSELGVAPQASDEEIRRAYLKLLREHHPQFLRHVPASTREASHLRLAEARQAYQIALGKST